MSYLPCSTWLEASSLAERALSALPGPSIPCCQAFPTQRPQSLALCSFPAGRHLRPILLPLPDSSSGTPSALGSKRYGVILSLGGALEAFPAWLPSLSYRPGRAVPEMGGTSLRSHPKGLTPSHVQKQEPDMVDIDYVHGGSRWWLGRVLAPP